MSVDVSAVNALPSVLTVKTALGDRAFGTLQVRPGDVMKTEPPVSMDTLLGELTKVSAAFNKRLTFSINEKINEVVVKVIDTDTDKVIREIPPAEIQHVHERIREVIGILFDEKA